MDDGKRRGGLPDLVGLEMPDEVPAGAGEAGCRRDLPLSFLDLVLAEVAVSRLPRRAHSIGVERLGNGHQGDVCGAAAGPPRSGPDAGVYGREVCRDLVVVQQVGGWSVRRSRTGQRIVRRYFLIWARMPLACSAYLPAGSSFM